MADTLAYRCLKYQGQKLKYTNGRGKTKVNVLDNVFFKHHADGTSSYVASFRYDYKIMRYLFDTKLVPLTDVVLPPTNSPEMGRRNYTGSSQSSAASGTKQTRNIFPYYGDVYKVTTWENFKKGDEVVWNKYSDKDEACLGRIVVTAERENVVGELYLVAIVSLERIPTGKNGWSPSRQINYLDGVKNTFLVPENELLKLSEWIAVMTKAGQDEWQTVTRQKGKKGKQEPRRDDYGIFPHSPQSQLPSSSKNVSTRGSFGEDYWYDENRHEEKNAESSEEEEDIFMSVTDWKLPLDQQNFSRKLKQKDACTMGVQGNNNSCYMDASLFALFSFMHILDKFIITADENFEDSNSSNSRLKVVLKNIMFYMRQAPYFVPKQSIQKMRKIFGEAFSREYLFLFMDVEDFLGDFFKLLDVPPFLHYDNGEGDYIHQIALPFTWEKSEYTSYLSLQSLLENSFKTFEVKLEKMPEDIFIVKLPVSNGVLIPCRGVIPDLNLDLVNILEPHSETEEDNYNNTKMTLYSVICLRNNHFVTWVRADNSLNSPWVYMDSRPTVQTPFVCYIPNVDQFIRNALHELNNVAYGGDIAFCEPKCENFSLFQHAYVCIYVKQ